MGWRIFVWFFAITFLVSGVSCSGGGAGLMNAAEKGDIAKVNKLIAKGARVNATREDGATALMMAALKGHADVVKALLAGGAQVNAKDKSLGVTALMLASSFGHYKVAEALIANGADVNAKTVKGGTALMGAADKGHKNIVRLLKMAGAKG